MTPNPPPTEEMVIEPVSEERFARVWSDPEGWRNLFVGVQGFGLRPNLFEGRITVTGTIFTRGDANLDELVNIGDAVAMLDHLFNSAPALCFDALDANDDGTVNIADPIALLAYLFSGGEELPDPFPGAGIDPTADGLDCQG